VLGGRHRARLGSNNNRSGVRGRLTYPHRSSGAVLVGFKTLKRGRKLGIGAEKSSWKNRLCRGVGRSA
jgi:hypothetical protein